MLPALRLVRGLPAPMPAAALPSAEPSDGKLIELSGTRGCARATAAVSALRQAQLAGETTAWIQRAHGPLFPPDLSDGGVDLAALAVVHVPESARAAGLFKAAEMLLRSGAFGLVVVDLRETPVRVDAAWQGRLLGLAREHRSRVLFLTTKSSGSQSIGPLIGLRIEPRRVRLGPGTFRLEPQVLKNKGGAGACVPAGSHRGPWGLR